MPKTKQAKLLCPCGSSCLFKYSKQTEKGGRRPRGREEITREDGAVWREQKYIPLSLRTQLRGLLREAQAAAAGRVPARGRGWAGGGEVGAGPPLAL